MPAEGLPSIPKGDLLTATEIARLVGIAGRDLGVHEVRFTGGEPLTRADLVEIIARSSAAAPGMPLSMTTNGIGLDKVASRLVEAGLGRVNISVDTIDREHFARLTRRDRLPAVLAGIDGAVRAGLGPIKLNAVLMRETLDDAPALLAWAVERGLRLRFIEQMPLDADAAWRRANMVPAAELLEVLSRSVRAEPRGARRSVRTGRGVARRRRPRDRRHHRVGHAIVLRGMRPHAGSRPRERCGRACSATTRRTCAGCCAAERTTVRSRTGGVRRCGASRPVTASPIPDFVPPERSMGAIGG